MVPRNLRSERRHCCQVQIETVAKFSREHPEHKWEGQWPRAEFRTQSSALRIWTFWAFLAHVFLRQTSEIDRRRDGTCDAPRHCQCRKGHRKGEASLASWAAAGFRQRYASLRSRGVPRPRTTAPTTILYVVGLLRNLQRTTHVVVETAHYTRWAVVLVGWLGFGARAWMMMCRLVLFASLLLPERHNAPQRA